MRSKKELQLDKELAEAMRSKDRIAEQDRKWDLALGQGRH